MESKMRTYLQINPKDNVAVALAPLSSGTAIELDGISLTLAEDIPQGHKFALKQIPEDGQVIKYGCPIGIAKEDILPGHWVHIHNIKTGLGDLLTYTSIILPQPSNGRHSPSSLGRSKLSLHSLIHTDAPRWETTRSTPARSLPI